MPGPDSAVTDVIFEPLSDAFAQNPYPTYAALRQRPQLTYHEAGDLWLLSRFDEVDAAACSAAMVRDPALIMTPAAREQLRRDAGWHDMPNHERFVQFSLLECDGALHDRLRLVVLREFTRTFIEKHRPMVEAHIHPLLDTLLERGEFDVVVDLAQKVPSAIIGGVLGVPEADCPQLRVWSESIVQFFNVGRTAEHKALAEQATTEFSEFLRRLIEERRRKPRDDLLSVLLTAREADKLTETELISTCMLILAGGHGSTIDVIGTSLKALLEHPAQLEALRATPRLLPRAIQELFRFETPLPFFHRYCTEPVSIRGQRFPTGTRFGLLYGSANRDAHAYPEPNSLQLDRSPNRHLAFGRGAHLCLGNHLARLELEVLFARLLAYTQAIEMLIDRPRYKPGLAERGLEALPIRVNRR